ncbi:MAG TPA: glycosyltransferase [Devosiaceae bacterium]|jgi:UDP:flavonoid glycosyltransferase YjiC (YdhE family)|nr:glycosyltransferase [Devosiaceae bacterium]
MRISIQTLGTRGDVQPYVALARGLLAAGHEVQLVAPAQFEDFVRAHGPDFAALPGEFLDLIETPAAKQAIAQGRGFSAGFKLLKQLKPMMRRVFDATWEASRAFGPALIVHHPKVLAAPHIGEKLGVPLVLASPLPGFTPTAAFPSPLLPNVSLGPLNRLSHQLMAWSGAALFSRPMAQWRAERLGLPRRGRTSGWRDLPTLYAYSPTLLPVPPEWGPNVLVSGFWFLDDETAWTPQTALADFLAAGEAPVYVGFGSMPVADPMALTALVVEATARAGCRAVLAAGRGKLGGVASAPHVHVVDEAPHDRLFPLVSAVVHHGGAGSTAAGLRAGKPTVICPFFGDQPFWGRRVAALGVGPSPIPQRDLTAERLAEAIRLATTDSGMRSRAEALGAAMRAEDGVAAAVAFIERHSGARA